MKALPLTNAQLTAPLTPQPITAKGQVLERSWVLGSAGAGPFQCKAKV